MEHFSVPSISVYSLYLAYLRFSQNKIFMIPLEVLGLEILLHLV